MIARLNGTVWSIGDNYAVIRTGGIGLRVHTPTSVLEQLDGAGQPVELFTHLHVRENELALYGFLTEDELALFKLLLSVSGVGPKVALTALGFSLVEAQTALQSLPRDEEMSIEERVRQALAYFASP